MTDEEVGLARAMIAKGIRNDQVHFYFNRSDRLISSGRIAQIKTGSYAKDVPAATEAELAAFLAKWEVDQATGHRKGPLSPTDVEYIKALFEKRKSQWFVCNGETDVVECKLNYSVSGPIIKAIAGLANNKGGHILFGVRDKTNVVEGMSDDKFHTLDPAILNSHLLSSLDPVPKVTRVAVTLGQMSVGAIHVEKQEEGPVIAVKSVGDLKEGGIYFRYVGETRLIKPGELRQIIKAREQKAVEDFSRRMSRVASGSEATIDLDTGEVAGRTGRFLIDKELLPSIQFIREGDFSEVKGAPALRVVGEVQPISAAERTKVHVIRENITPDSIIENFLLDANVQEPLQYLHAQAHYPRKWMPIWHYVDQLSTPVDEIVEDLRTIIASVPTSRDAVVQRLRGTLTAHKLYTGSPAKILPAFLVGKINAPKTVDEFGAFANAVQGLPNDFKNAGDLRPILLSCLKRDNEGKHRSAIYRAASRLDEILHSQRDS
ncbi:ATP-binding protein [Bradyrhizobium sp. C-145]|uniref:ATP-binding protein n=1 Tax=Bradyrhizobium sp. C-145 TaxID=574727 RepID=UPI00201B79C8|nr:ATP-binding protein [Bradyrhizobium sp. C-145]UQR64285.1 ATP-binding protein [Bradyrhizobium sp. C-145]